MLKQLRTHRTLILRLLLCIVSFALAIFTFTSHSFAGDDKDKDFSFYKVSSAISAYYDESHNDSKDAKDKKFKDNGAATNAGSFAKAGNFVGFVDQDYNNGFFGATISYLSGSSQNRSYTAYTFEKCPALRAYVQYGHALNSLGLDSTANVAFDIMFIFRGLGGMILGLFYTTALSVETVFYGVLTMLQTLNPFAWFLHPDADTPFKGWFAEAADHMPGAFIGLQQVVSRWYGAFYKLGVVMIPLYAAIAIAMIILGKISKGNSTTKEGVFSRIKKLSLRIVFIFAGIPLLGACYTGALDALLKGSGGRGHIPAANTVLCSTLVDFEAWSLRTHLALPSGAHIGVRGLTGLSQSYVSLSETSALRDLALGINHLARPSMCDAPIFSNSDVHSSTVTPELVGNTAQAIVDGYGLIARFGASTFYDASDFETVFKRWHSNKLGSGKEATNLMDQIKADGDIGNYYKDSRIDGGKGGVYTKDNKSGDLGYKGSAGEISYSGNASDVHAKGLTSLAMYNYLTSSFSDSNITTYSAHKATSAVMRQAHHSVNLIGNGMGSFIYFMYAVVMFLAMTVIGWCYAFAIFINCIKRGVSMIAGLPMAMLGNLKAMAKAVTIVMMMVVELIGTAFIYRVVIELLLSMHEIFEAPLQELLAKPGSVGSTIIPTFSAVIPGMQVNDLGMLDGIVAYISIVAAIVMNILFTFWAVKFRRQFVKAIDGQLAGFIDRIFATAGPNGGGVAAGVASKPSLGERAMHGLKDAAGRGAGVMMGNAMGTGAGMAANALLGKGDAAMPGGGGIGSVVSAATGSDATGAGGEGGGTGSPHAGIEGGAAQLIGDGASMATGAGDPASAAFDAGEKLIDGASLADNAADNIAKDAGKDSMESISGNDGVTSTSAPSAGGEALPQDENAERLESSKALGQTSAMEDEAMDESKAAVKKEADKQAKTGMLKAAVGAAETAVGAYTGNAQMTMDGAKRTMKGLSQAQQANQLKAQAGHVAAQQVAAKQAANGTAPSRESVNGSKPAAGGSAIPQQRINGSTGGSSLQQSAVQAQSSQRPPQRDDTQRPPQRGGSSRPGGSGARPQVNTYAPVTQRIGGGSGNTNNYSTSSNVSRDVNNAVRQETKRASLQVGQVSLEQSQQNQVRQQAQNRAPRPQQMPSQRPNQMQGQKPVQQAGQKIQQAPKAEKLPKQLVPKGDVIKDVAHWV